MMELFLNSPTRSTNSLIIDLHHFKDLIYHLSLVCYSYCRSAIEEKSNVVMTRMRSQVIVPTAKLIFSLWIGRFQMN